MREKERVVDLIKHRKNVPRSFINFIDITG